MVPREVIGEMKSIAALMVLVFAVLACGEPQDSPSTAEGAGAGRLVEDLIAEAYFRSYFSRCEQGQDGVMFFSFGRMQDPPFLFLARFRRSGFVVRPISQCDRSGPEPCDRETGEKGVVVALTRVDMITGKRAVASGYYTSRLSEGFTYTCIVENVEGSWTVTKTAVTKMQ